MKTNRNILALLLLLFIIIGDYYSSFFCNGVLFTRRALNTGAYLEKVVDDCFIYDDLIILYPNNTYKCGDNSEIYVDNIWGYSQPQDSLIVEVSSPNGIVYLAFDNEESMHKHSPAVYKTYNKDIHWYNLKDKPAFAYYWRLIFFVSFIVIIFECIRLLIRLMSFITISFCKFCDEHR